MSGTEAQEPPTAGPELPVPLAELTRSLGRTVKPLENRTEVDIKNILTSKRTREIVTSMQDASIELGVEIEGLDEAVMDISRLLRQLQVAPVKVRAHTVEILSGRYPDDKIYRWSPHRTSWT